MAWVKIGDTLPESDVFEREKVGALGGWMHVAALAYCNRTLNDGTFPRSRARRLIDIDDPDSVIDALIEYKLWQAAGADVVIVDYLVDQPSRVKVEATRAAWKDRQEKSRERARNRGNGRESRRDKGRDDTRDSASPVPVPDRAGTAHTASSASAPDAGAQPAIFVLDVDNVRYLDYGTDELRAAFKQWAAARPESGAVGEHGNDDAGVIDGVSVSLEHITDTRPWDAAARAWLAARPEHVRIED